MAIHSKSPTPPSQPSSAAAIHDLKQRVITSLNKLADRDTLALATNELESIARNLNHDSFSPFLSCLYNTDSSSKSPVRKQCVALLSTLSRSHGNSLSPHLPKMVSTILRRLRDPDSAVRSACATAFASMSSSITTPSFSVFYKPLIDVLTHDHDGNVQFGAAMCLAAAVEAAPDTEAEHLRKVLPKLGKLLRSEGFKAKAALLGVIGSVVSAGGSGNKGVLCWLVPCVMEFLSNDDWAVRKAAAEVLGKIALEEKELAPEYKEACVALLESRRFDKIKIVRETMNHALEQWKQVSGDSEVSTPSHSISSSRDSNVSSADCSPSVAKNSGDVGFRTPRSKKTVSTINRSPPPSGGSCVSFSKKEHPIRRTNKNSSKLMSSKQDHKKPLNWKSKIAELQSPSSFSYEVHTPKSDPTVLKSEEKWNSRPEIKHVLLSNNCEEKSQNNGDLRSGSRVAPCYDDDNNDSVDDVVVEEDHNNSVKEAEELCLIHEQLAQIENQQSNLLDLLQRFIGSSKSGINSLESRVHGIEMALDDISYGLTLSSGRTPNGDYAENTCCKLPGSEFLSSKFYRKTDGRSGSKFSSPIHMQSLKGIYDMPDKEAYSRTYKPDSLRFQQEYRRGPIMNPVSDVCSDTSGPSGFRSNRISKFDFYGHQSVQNCNAGRFVGASSGTFTTPMNLSNRVST